MALHPTGHHVWFVTFQLAEVGVPRRLYQVILERIRRFAAPSPREARTIQVKSKRIELGSPAGRRYTRVRKTRAVEPGDGQMGNVG